jgi:hypothetical protein
MKLQRSQSGVTLFIALIFLLVMTLFAVSSVNMSTVNLRIIGNMQAIKLMEALAQDAIEQMLSDSSRYGVTPNGDDIEVSFLTADEDEATLMVVIDDPVCLDSVTATGYSAVQEAIIPEDATWEITAHVQDPVTGAKVDVHQGFEMRMLANNCPDPS